MSEEFPERIWLQPKCCANGSEGQLWCEDNVWADQCAGGVKPAEYRRVKPRVKRKA